MFCKAVSEKVRKNLRIIARTQTTPHIPLSVGLRISDECAAQIADLLLKLKTTTDGKNVLKHNNFSSYKEVSAEEYEKIGELLVQ